MRYIALILVLSPQTSAQNPPHALTAEEYSRAAQFLGARANPLVLGTVDSPRWLAGDNLVYRTRTAQGFEFIRVDPVAPERKPAFDHQKMALSLSAVSDTVFDNGHLPFTPANYSDDGRSISFTRGSRSFTCDIGTYHWTVQPSEERDAIVSPDGRLAAFIREYDLWVRDLSTGNETRLTTDGARDFGYATNNAGWVRAAKPVLLWSPQSDKIATFQQDVRGVGAMYLVSTRLGHSTLDQWKGALAGDSVIATVQRVIIHLKGPRVVRLLMPPDPQRSTITDHIAGKSGEFLDVEWREDGSELLFVSTSRDHKIATLRAADPETGKVRDVIEEKTRTYFESGRDRVNWQIIPGSNNVLWYSERDNRGHLYVYDLGSGKLLRQITRGDWTVLQVLRIGEGKVYFLGSGRESGDPYFQYLYSVTTEGKDLSLLTPERANHSVSLSSKYILDSFSTPQIPPTAVLRDLTGRKVLTLENADISRLVGFGWQPPISITVKARDGVTDLYGLMYRPTRFDSATSYPIVNYVYPGPQKGPIDSRSFSAARKGEQALAELGCVVIEVDAFGTPGRTKSFHDAYYGNMGDNGLPDQIAAIRALAGRYSWLDTTRVGIWGHSGGGYAAADGILRYPDFYKVAVSEAGNHDNRNYEDNWGEKWQGLVEQLPDGSTSYDNQANELLVRNLKGKLLLVHGTLDDNVPPSNTLLMVDSLIAANKDFDLLLLPNRRHSFGDEPYMIRRRWDYFVRWLIGVEPPKEVDLAIFRATF